MRKLSTLSGLGDAVYAFPIVSHLAKFSDVMVSTQYPEVFADIPNVVATGDKLPGSICLRYSRQPGSNYWQDVKSCVGPLSIGVEFEFTYSQTCDRFDLPKNRHVCLIKEPSTAHMHRDRNDFQITPDADRMQNFILENKHRFYFVSVEHETNNIHKRLIGIDERFSRLTTHEYLALCVRADAIASQICHLVPIAQGLRKELHVFAPRGPLTGFLRNLTVEQVLAHKERVTIWR